MNVFYLLNLLIYAGVDATACLGLSQQFGVAGVTNFGFIIFQAAGGYTAAVLAMPPKSANGGFQSYIGGLNLPFPLPWIGAAVVGGLIALPFTFLVGRRLRGDFAAVGLLVTAVLLNLLVTNYVPLFNGDAGLSLIPAPLRGNVFSVQSTGYQWGFAAGALLLGALVYLFVRRITESPYGRTLRAMRDNDAVADSLGKNLLSLRTGMLVLGGAIAGLSGGILVSYITTWSPAAWGYAETVVLFAAVIIGGAGNHLGAVLGAVLVPVGFEEVTRFIPTSNNLPPNLIPSLEWVAIGLLIVVFLWVRPQGVLPERKRVIPLPAGQSAGDGDGTAPAAPVSVRERPRAPASPPGPAGADGGQAGETVLEAVGLVREFGGLRAVNGVSLSVRQGTLTGLIGPNGAGKSTLLAVLAGTLPASAGTIIYRGQDITGMPAFRRARLGLVRTFQLASEFKRLTVMENLLSAVPANRGDSLRGAIAGKRYWRADEAAAIARAQVILRRFGLEALANHYAGDLSGGQRRLVEIMRALMTEPRMLLLDEPMAGVHPNLARRIGNELVALCNEGMTILMVEHELAIMDEFADPVVVMAEGEVLAEGTMQQLRGRSEVVEAYLVG
jgi:branched-chain amino acid transport system permease protein